MSDGDDRGMDAGDFQLQVMADQLQAQRALVELETHVLRRWMFAAPATVPFTWAPGSASEQSEPGDQRDPYNGVAVLNTTPYPIRVGFEAGAAAMQPKFTVPAGGYVVYPFRYVNLSLALIAPGVLNGVLGPAQPTCVATAIRLRIPPLGIDAGPLSPTVAAGPAEGYAVPVGTSVGAGLTTGANGDLYVAGFTSLKTLAALVTPTPAELTTDVRPYDVDGTLYPHGLLPTSASVAAASGGTTRQIKTYDVTGLDRVRLLLTNGNAGAQLAQLSYFLR